MKLRIPLAAICGLLLAGLPTLAARAQELTNDWDHFTIRPRAAFNISAKFNGIGSLSLTPTRKTPNGDNYNYDNGYVLTDKSGSAGGQTWYWGYDSSGQIAGNTIQMNRSVSLADGTISAGQDYHDASFGGDITYSHRFGTLAGVDYGLEAAGNYMYISRQDSTSIQGDVSQVTDAFSFAGGTTPPGAPYQGGYTGPGYLIGSTPSATSSTLLAGAATITGHRQLRADLFGMRLGPCVEMPLEKDVGVRLSAGLAAGLLRSSASWTETVAVAGGPTVSGSGGGSNFDFLYGGYLAAGLSWQVSRRWTVEADAQYLNLGYARETLGGRSVELDLHRSIIFSLGAGFNF